MNASYRASLIATYIQRFATGSPNSRSLGENKDESTFWAYSELADIGVNRPLEAFDLVLEILSATNDVSVLSNLSAGALEDLIHHHGSIVIDAIEREAARNPKFVELMQGVWPTGAPEIWGRIRAAIPELPEMKTATGMGYAIADLKDKIGKVVGYVVFDRAGNPMSKILSHGEAMGLLKKLEEDRELEPEPPTAPC